MGAVEVSLSNPNVVYAGTGSSKIRSNVSIGRGIYKSTDAGQDLELHRPARRRARSPPCASIPTNPDIVYVAALGNPFVDNKERGVYQIHRRRQDLEEGAVRLRQRCGAADLELQPGSARTSSSPACGTGSASRGPSSAARAKAASTRAPTAATPGPNSAGGLPDELFGRSNVAISAADAESHLRADRGEAGLGPVPLGGRGRDLDPGQRRGQSDHAAVLLRPRSAWIPTTPNVVCIGNEGWFKSTDGGKTFRRVARAARRPSRHLDQSARTRST